MSAQVQTSNEFRVPIKSFIRADTYRELNAFANEHKVTVGEVLAGLADRAIAKPEPTATRKPIVRMNPERLNRLVQLRKAGHTWSAIADAIGISLASAHNHGKKLGL